MASAARLKAKGEADAIETIADAKSYEIQKAKEDMETYLQLKRLEIEKLKLEKWDGRFPTYYMGSSSPDLLLQLPKPDEIHR